MTRLQTRRCACHDVGRPRGGRAGNAPNELRKHHAANTHTSTHCTALNVVINLAARPPQLGIKEAFDQVLITRNNNGGCAASIMSENSAQVAEFCAITDAAPHIAEAYLESCSWSLEAAVDMFFNASPPRPAAAAGAGAQEEPAAGEG